MGTSVDFLKKQLNGAREIDVRRVCKTAVELAIKFGGNVREKAVQAAMNVLDDEGKHPSEAIVEHFVMEAMAGKELPMDFVGAEPGKETKGEDIK